MECKLLISVLLFCSWALLGMSQGDGGSGSGSGSDLPCVKDLLPCKDYLRPSTRPPPLCCIPLKKMIDTEKQCLCAILNNPELLRSFNVTRDQAKQLPKECGDTTDTSICDTAANGTATPPTTPSAPSGPSNGSSTPTASGLPSVDGSSVIAFIAVGWLSLFVLVLKV
ncbi:non-specific lipid transfer protein GPI-anchored 3 [Magnolia sinica]|uniref:non-specific lipid transfer protein GPI-anchored 3 n=1 Tax=Magnolia sinica TaxID=86752 RepID=UPI002658AD2B|nr:non-specific lipid transfer protein GPI-anchored 3 [Magnolia sinica]